MGTLLGTCAKLTIAASSGNADGLAGESPGPIVSCPHRPVTIQGSLDRAGVGLELSGYEPTGIGARGRVVSWRAVDRVLYDSKWGSALLSSGLRTGNGSARLVVEEILV